MLKERKLRSKLMETGQEGHTGQEGKGELL